MQENTSSDEIANALAAVRKRIELAALAAARPADSVRLVAVSKTKSAQAVRAAYSAGQRDFGENYVQELVAKAEALADLRDLRWHLIGHLQTNKVKYIAGIVAMVQTVDSERVAQELNRRAALANRQLPVLLEINVGGEAQKSGVSAAQAPTLMQAVRSMEHLQVRGLMTVPPFELEASQTRVYFERLRLLREELGGESELPELSMGMSHDFEEAIGQGATMVRVGTAVFGSRS